jgi:uncharacterized membrane protein
MAEPRGRLIFLWAIVALFAAFTILTTVDSSIMTPGLIGIINTILLVAFALVHGSARYGARGIAAFVIICLVVSNIFENLSIVTGFPFGHYHYTDVLGPKLFLVPVTIGGAYFGAGYLSWTMSQVLLGRNERPIDSFSRWALPVAAAFVMAAWDFMLDPGASIINHYWIWEGGGGYFGVPFSNYLGWLMTVFLFFAVFAWHVSRTVPVQSQSARYPRAFWAQAILMYAILGGRYFLTYFVPSDNSAFTDATGHVWLRHDIYETTAIAAIFTVLAFAAFAGFRLGGEDGRET